MHTHTPSYLHAYPKTFCDSGAEIFLPIFIQVEGSSLSPGQLLHSAGLIRKICRSIVTISNSLKVRKRKDNTDANTRLQPCSLMHINMHIPKSVEFCTISSIRCVFWTVYLHLCVFWGTTGTCLCLFFSFLPVALKWAGWIRPSTRRARPQSLTESHMSVRRTGTYLRIALPTSRCSCLINRSHCLKKSMSWAVIIK